ncbi:MAG TPA: hypothetical protein EYN66_14075 [Myxococcales bacterium]|nr:hypothetical protein [Myxococcales bacterium]
MGQDWKVAITPECAGQLGIAPRKIQKRVQKQVYQELRSSPDNHTRGNIKKLANFKDLWRYRIDDYRLIYYLDRTAKKVELFKLGPRDKVYDQIGFTPGKGPPIEIVANPNLEHYLEKVPTPVERGQAIIEVAAKGQAKSLDRAKATELPEPITKEWLDRHKIDDPGEVIVGTHTDSELLALEHKGVSTAVLEKILNLQYPLGLAAVLQAPVREIPTSESLQQFVDGERTLESFLLDLDETQRPFVRRFSHDNPIGPWLLKGGPGSGKSTVALYCIRELAQRRMGSLPNLNEPKLRILFTTYTHSLTNASRHLLKQIGVSDDPNVVCNVVNTDSLYGKYLSREQQRTQPIGEASEEAEELIKKAIAAVDPAGRYFGRQSHDWKFISSEVSRVIIGEGLERIDDYVALDRKGRGRALNKNQREMLWQIYQVLVDELQSADMCFYVQRAAYALKAARAEYDYVFIDEAQDLTPVAIRFCVALAKAPERVFLTADLNQAIHGGRLSWQQVATDLKFTGRTTILRRNFRSTSEIWDGIAPILSGIDGADKETLCEEMVLHGEMPELALTPSFDDTITLIRQWLHNALISERVPPSCAVVLCYTNKRCVEIAEALPANLNAIAMVSKKLDLEHPGVKVTTMSASKGLEFPVVIVVGLCEGEFPRRSTGTQEDRAASENEQRRLFFVACSRAMRRLLVVGSSERPSPFLKYLSDEDWRRVD